VPINLQLSRLQLVSSLLLFGFGTNCLLMSLCTLPSRPTSLDWRASQRLRRQFRDICPVFISRSSKFLSVCGTWIYRLLSVLHAHLPCTTLLNSEECALSEKKKKSSSVLWIAMSDASSSELLCKGILLHTETQNIVHPSLEQLQAALTVCSLSALCLVVLFK